MSWLTNPEEAAQHPRLVLFAMPLVGLILGGAIGYWRFDGSWTSTTILGLSFVAIFAYFAWKTVREPGWAQRRRSQTGTRRALTRLAIPFLVIGVAFVIGLATHSVAVFIVAVAVGLGLGLVVRVTVLR